ncbi:MAG: transglycosylase domain-containing protein [Corynebacterium sphenisci]|nr:transglycosylase domain-containing protein [Corynebacterium sphenisci]MDO5730949.1 transglycosylase domain-containing protein [Corynebacterium sphenisci]
MNQVRHLLALLAATALAGLLMASAAFPVAGLAGYLLTRTADAMADSSRSLSSGDAPQVSTIEDATGEPIAWLYEQRRHPVPPEGISAPMKDAIVAIEDRRFWEHSGVDWQGTARAALANLTAGAVRQGASTIEQQFVKNHALLVEARTDAERRQAVATDYGRKLREIRIAQDLDETMTKDEVLTGYLNLVPFGNGAFGVEAAARTYFGIGAAELDLAQAALLAGMVQQSSGLDPYANPDGALARRTAVLDAMVDVGVADPAAAAAAKDAPLGILPEPARLPQGCIAAGDRGFFCDYVVDWLGRHGVDAQRLARGGYTVRTTLDPGVQDAARAALTAQADPAAPGVAEVLNVVEPGADSRRVLAMASSRDYGLDAEAAQTVQPQPWAMLGNGAGSIHKIFAATAAIERGMGTEAKMAVPRRYEASGLGEGGAEDCPPGKYCVENAGEYRPRMSLTEALAHSPNTAFVMLAEQVGVPAVVDAAVRLGMRSYAEPGSFDGDASVADYVSDNTLGSFVLGPTPASDLELANVGATLASDGRWCEPSPVESIVDRAGAEVPLDTVPCEDAVEPGVARAMARALSRDTVEGTAKEAAAAAGWSGDMAAKTGTTESHQSAAFLGFTRGLSAATYVYNDSTSTAGLCTSPLRQCADGDLYGGKEPARTWFAAIGPIIDRFGGPGLPEMDPRYKGNTAEVPDVIGRTEGDARRILEEAGFRVTSRWAAGTGKPRGRVTGIANRDAVLEGGLVDLEISDGSRPRPKPPERRRPGNRWRGPGFIDVPGLGRVPLPN